MGSFHDPAVRLPAGLLAFGHCFFLALLYMWLIVADYRGLKVQIALYPASEQWCWSCLVSAAGRSGTIRSKVGSTFTHNSSDTVHDLICFILYGIVARSTSAANRYLPA